MRIKYMFMGEQILRQLREWRRRISTPQFLKMTGGFVVLVIVGFTVFASPAYATGFEDVFNGLVSVITTVFLSLAQLAMSLAIFMLQFFIQLAQYNGYIDAPPVIIGWAMLRDLANMFFVVILLVIAFGTMLGLEQYEWKKALPKLVGAAVLINFSKMIAQLMIDVAHVATLTFLNAVQATAGGNLINMFQLDGILKMTGNDTSFAGGGGNFREEVLVAAVLALFFALLVMFTIGAYAFIMAARVVVLWVLIILAPLAYIMGVIPKTATYASEYWTKFFNQVVVAPVMAFFLWLSFATLGTGNIGSQIGLKYGADVGEGAIANPAASILDVSTWENMSNFILGIAFMWIGIMVVQKLGVVGGEVTQKAQSFAKTATGVLSGYTAGRWAAGKGVAAVKDVAKDYRTLLGEKTGLNRVPVFGSQSAGAIKRKAAVAKVEALQASRRGEITAQGGGLAGVLAPSNERRAKAAIRKDIAERKKTASETKSDKQLRLKILRDEEKKYDTAYKNLLEPFEKEMQAKKAELEASKVGKNSGEQEEIQKQINDLFPVAEKKRAEFRREAAKQVGGYGYIESLHLENEGKRPAGKFESEQTRVVSGVVDEQRVSEGKSRKAVRAYEMQQVKEDLDDYENYTYVELFDEIEKNLNIMKKYKGVDEKKLKEEDFSAYEELKNARQNQGRALASAYTKGDGEFLASSLTKIDKSFANVKFNEGENSHILDMALLSGASFEEFGGSVGDGKVSATDALQKQTAIEKNIRRGLKEKENIITRGLMVARDVDVSKHNSLESAHQMSVGVDEHGEKIITYTNLMGAGRAAQKGGYATGEIDKDGKTRRKSKYDVNVEGKRIKDIAGGSLGDGRIEEVLIDGVKVELSQGFVSKEVEQMVAQIGDMTASEIKQMTKEQLNRTSGGQYDRSSYSAQSGKFVVANAEMARAVGGIFKRFNANLDNTKSPAGKDNIRKAIRTYFEQSGEKDDASLKALVQRVENGEYNEIIETLPPR